MSVRDLSAFFDDDGLEYPGVPSRAHPGGKTYRVPSPDAATGLRLTAVANIGLRASSGGELSAKDRDAVNLADDEEEDLYRKVLGPVYDEMVADGVKWMLLQRVAQDAFLTFTVSPEVADAALQVVPGKAETSRGGSTRPTTRRAAGSKSSAGSGRTPARTRRTATNPRNTGRSSTSPTAPEAKQAV